MSLSNLHLVVLSAIIVPEFDPAGESEDWGIGESGDWGTGRTELMIDYWKKNLQVTFQ